MADERKYKPLPAEQGRLLRGLYEVNLPRILKDPSWIPTGFFTRYGTVLATKYERVVIGDYGAFIEFSEGQVVRANIKPKWAGEPKRDVKYIWWVPRDGAEVRLYEQKAEVPYADYKVGRWYVDPHEIIIV